MYDRYLVEPRLTNTSSEFVEVIKAKGSMAIAKIVVMGEKSRDI